MLAGLTDISFPLEQFGSLFPYFICIGEAGQIESHGNYIGQVCQIAKGQPFSDFFECIRNPALGSASPHAIPVSEMVLVHSIYSPLVYFKGKFEKVSETGRLMFFGTPCYITRSEEIEQQFRFIDEPSFKMPVHRADNPESEYFDNLEETVRFYREMEESQDAVYKSDDEYAITVSNQEGKVVWCNDAFLALTGRSWPEVMGKRPRESMYGERSVYIGSDYVDTHVRKGEPFYFEILATIRTEMNIGLGLPCGLCITDRMN